MVLVGRCFVFDLLEHMQYSHFVLCLRQLNRERARP